jgi:hypothetical protein
MALLGGPYGAAKRKEVNNAPRAHNAAAAGKTQRSMTFKSQDSAANRPWRWMLAVDSFIALAGILFTLFLDSPRMTTYLQLLVTYHFGFVRRALVGEIVSWFTDVVPIWYLYAIAVVAWIATLVLFVAAFRKVFGFNDKNFPLFVFLFGSPFFLKNFAITLTHFDIFGCIWALAALLIPARPLYPLIIAAGCIVLVLMHNLHFLLYIPTIGFIVFVRYGALPKFSTANVVYCCAAGVLVCAAFLATVFFGSMPVPRETFLAYVSARAADPFDPINAWMWYSTIGQEIQSTWDHRDITFIRLPIYAVLIVLHLPVARYLKTLILALAQRWLRVVSVAALAVISVGYIAIFVVAYDYSRWVSSWAVCMFLMLHAIRLLPSAASDGPAPIRPDKAQNLVLGWIVTAIPRVGVTIPF